MPFCWPCTRFFVLKSHKAIKHICRSGVQSITSVQMILPSLGIVCVKTTKELSILKVTFTTQKWDAYTFAQQTKSTVDLASWIDIHPCYDLSNSPWPCYSPSRKPALLRPQYVRVNKSQLHFSMLTEREEEKLCSKQITWLPWAKTLQTGCGRHTHQSKYFDESHLLRTERRRHNRRRLFFSTILFSRLPLRSL